MRCGHCPEPARYLVVGGGQRRYACDACLTRVQRAAGTPRSTERVTGAGQMELDLGEATG